MPPKKAIVYLGYNNFPRGLAEAQKIVLISKSLLLTGNRVTVICRNGYHDKTDDSELKPHGVYDNVEYIYASGSVFRNESFFKRRILKIKGVCNEMLILIRRKKNNNLDFAILSTRNFYTVLLYTILARFIGFKTILNYVEYYSSFQKKWFHFGQRLNDKLFDKYAPRLTSGSLPISDFLIDHIKKISPQKKYLKLPGLTNFEKYKDTNTLPGEKYFLFCGSAAFSEIIYFCIDSFGLLSNDAVVFLYLVINGSKNDILEIKQYINNHPKKDKIKVFSNLEEKQLYSCYKNAVALLIPLRPTFQDIARFPHKTGEYLASGNPVISTNYGEIKHYFKDMKSMLLADSYDEELFAEKMQFVIDNPLQVKEIGENGKSIASEIFDYRNRAVIIDNFFETQF